MRFGRKLPDAHERHRVGVLHDIAVDQHFQLVEVSERMRTEKIHDTSLLLVEVSERMRTEKIHDTSLLEVQVSLL